LFCFERFAAILYFRELALRSKGEPGAKPMAAGYSGASCHEAPKKVNESAAFIRKQAST
jgi:hypothetical protein